MRLTKVTKKRLHRLYRMSCFIRLNHLLCGTGKLVVKEFNRLGDNVFEDLGWHSSFCELVLPHPR